MKKLFIYLFCMFWSNILLAQAAVMPGQIPAIQGNTITMSSYSGKKIVVAVCSAAAPDVARLKLLDTLQKSNPQNIQVIVMPIQDFDGTAVNNKLKTQLIDSLQLSVAIAVPGKGQRAAGSSQQILLAWLTNKNSDIHFDVDIENPFQVFVLSESGMVYAVLHGAGDVSAGILKTVLSAKSPDQ